MTTTPWPIPRLRPTAAPLILASLLALAACGGGESPERSSGSREGAAGPRTHESLDATLWTTTSAEYHALAVQAFRMAADALRRGLADPSWTAAVEQTRDPSALPPAVILDVDQTVLDVAPFQAMAVREHRRFERPRWDAWVRQADAPPVPGALAFARLARELGVAVFYVTNRHAKHEEATLRNLEAAGFPVESGAESVLLREEREGWGGDKASRRAHLARTHRILLIVGDDLNDFVAGTREPGLGPAERLEAIRPYRDHWGTRWILLPNPVYGSWARALSRFESDLSVEETLRRKYEALW